MSPLRPLFCTGSDAKEIELQEAAIADAYLPDVPTEDRALARRLAGELRRGPGSAPRLHAIRERVREALASPSAGKGSRSPRYATEPERRVAWARALAADARAEAAASACNAARSGCASGGPGPAAPSRRSRTRRPTTPARRATWPPAGGGSTRRRRRGRAGPGATGSSGCENSPCFFPSRAPDCGA